MIHNVSLCSQCISFRASLCELWITAKLDQLCVVNPSNVQLKLYVKMFASCFHKATKTEKHEFCDLNISQTFINDTFELNVY